MTGTPEGSIESGFMEKPGIEPATSDLQDRFIPYTTAASPECAYFLFLIASNGSSIQKLYK